MGQLKCSTLVQNRGCYERIVFGKIKGLEGNSVWIKKESRALDTQEDESKGKEVIAVAAAKEKKEEESKEGNVLVKSSRRSLCTLEPGWLGGRPGNHVGTEALQERKWSEHLEMKEPKKTKKVTQKMHWKVRIMSTS